MFCQTMSDPNHVNKTFKTGCRLCLCVNTKSLCEHKRTKHLKQGADCVSV
eukprot:jgi/Antlo1/274/880